MSHVDTDFITLIISLEATLDETFFISQILSIICIPNNHLCIIGRLECVSNAS